MNTQLIMTKREITAETIKVVRFQKASAGSAEKIRLLEELHSARIPTFKHWADKYYDLIDGNEEDTRGEFARSWLKAITHFDRTKGISFDAWLWVSFAYLVQKNRVPEVSPKYRLPKRYSRWFKYLYTPEKKKENPYMFLRRINIKRRKFKVKSK